MAFGGPTTATSTLVNPLLVVPARIIKTNVVAVLTALLPTGDEKTDQRIEKAIEHLTKSLDPELWVDDSTLTEKGKKVFDEEKKAVKELRKIKDAPPEVGDAIDEIVTADRQLAQDAIDAAIAGGGDPNDIEKALREMAKAQEELDKGKPDKAIDHYKKAWEKAQKALK
jgi:tetratricopeptide (TPR) repeat protein